MDYKVDYDYNLLDDLGISVIKENETLEKQFAELIDIIESLNSAWDGFDCSIFQYISTNYIKGLGLINADIEYIGKYMRLAASIYSENDIDWGKTIKKIGEDYRDRDEKYNS